MADDEKKARRRWVKNKKKESSSNRMENLNAKFKMEGITVIADGMEYGYCGWNGVRLLWCKIRLQAAKVESHFDTSRQNNSRYNGRLLFRVQLGYIILIKY
jgi:hypothetical protein